MTDASKFVGDKLRELLPEDGVYRTGVLLLTYPPTKPGTVCRVAMGAAMKTADLDHAMDFIQLVKTLRRFADELEAHISGKVPLTEEIVDDG